MSKRLTIILSDTAEKYFNEVMGTLDLPTPDGGYTPPNQSQAISHIVEEGFMFEHFAGTSVTDWISTNYPKEYAEYLNRTKNPVVQECDATEAQ